MYEYLRGKLIDFSPIKATVEVNGIGYSLLIPLSSYSKLPAAGKEVLFYLSFIVREDSQRLFGFLTLLERNLFEKLTEVSGIGPKTALALIGHMEGNELQLAISRSDVNLLCKIPGVGKKTAERLVVELRDKIKTTAELAPAGAMVSGGGVASDAISALIHLGYNPLQAQKAIKTALSQSEREPELPNLIKAALRCF